MSDACSSSHSNYASRALSAVDFDAVFTLTQDKKFFALAQNVRNGDSESIKMMQQIALQDTPLGNEAEQLLFNLFSGQETGCAGIAHDIEQQSLRLFETSQLAASTIASSVSSSRDAASPSLFNRINEGKASSKLSSPSKLLYMAGSAAAASSATVPLARIAKIFKEDPKTKDWFQSSQTPDQELWSEGRLLFNQEIDTYAMQLGWNIPCLREDMVVKYIIENEGVPCPSAMALDHGGHYSLIYIFNDDPPGTAKSVFFSSIKGCGASIKVGLEAIGLPCEIADANLQANSPNACGMFVVELMKHLKDPTYKNIPSSERVAVFIKSFEQLSAVEQSQYNASKRRQLHGTLLDIFRISPDS